MSKNIEINYKDDAGYEELYPKTKTDVNYLSSTINTLYGFTGENSLDDALAQLFLGVGKYGYAIHVEYPDGSPAEGFTVTGIDHPDGSSAVVTDSGGDAVGVSAVQSVNIGIISPYIDVQNISNFSIQSVGILTDQTITLQFKTSEYEVVEESQDVFFSPFVIYYNLTAVGGGGGAMSWEGTSTRGGNGGGGGYVSTLLNIDNDGPINIFIGAGGETGNTNYGTQGGKGGTTIVSKKNTGENILTAVGGGGGQNRDTGGTGNGNGGRNYYRQDKSVTNGGNSTDRIFNDSSLPLAGGGGGGGFAVDNDAGKGGLPFGANGDVNDSGNATLSTGPTGPGGGGGGGGYGTMVGDPYGGEGGDGAVYIRCHYTA